MDYLLPTTGNRLMGLCRERSNAASSYRAEMLGLCALHLFARALTEYFKVNKWRATICCDNQRALEWLAHPLRRIKPSSKCADIRQSFRSTKQGLSGTFKYKHVYGNMDNYLLWHQLTIKQQINCVCNTLSKRAIKTAIRQGYQDTPTHLLPTEDVALVIKCN